MPDTTPSMPPLPEPDTHCYDEDTGEDVWSHSPAQVLAYAQAVADARVREAMERDALRGALALAGKMSEAARNVVGGKSITIGVHPPANVYNMGDFAAFLREAVDDYDAAILEMARKKP